MEVKIMKNILKELVLIRKELQAIRGSLESHKECSFTFDRAPYGRSYRLVPKQRCKGR